MTTINKPSAQEFNCGAQSVYENDGIRVRIYHEGGVYHVTVNDTEALKTIKSKCFHTLSEAWATFKRYTRLASI
jgi:hypothetical protein